MMETRCSQLPRLFKCAASVLGEDISVEHDQEAAEFGKTMHPELGNIVEGKPYDPTVLRDPSLVAKASDMLDYAHGIWHSDLEKYFPSPQVEAMVDVPIKGYGNLVGTLDVLSQIDEHRANIADWKTGIVQGYEHQGAGYAYSVWVRMGRPEDTRISVTMVYLWHRHWTVKKYLAADLRAWEHDLIHNALGAGPNSYRTGEHCSYCPKRHSCKARRSVVSGTVDALCWGQQGDPEHGEFFERAKASMMSETASTAELADLVKMLMHRVLLVRRAADEVWDLVRTTVGRLGDIRLDDETVVALKTHEKTKVRDAQSVYRFLVERVGEEAAQGCIDISIGRMKQAQRRSANGIGVSPSTAVAGLMEHLKQNRWTEQSDVQTLREMAIPVEKDITDDPAVASGSLGNSNAGPGGGQRSAE